MRECPLRVTRVSFRAYRWVPYPLAMRAALLVRLVPVVGALVVTVLWSCRTTASESARPRPTHWAQPVLGMPLENLHRVNAELYRCEQPTAAEMRALEDFGIRSVVNLRALHSDRDEVESTELVLHEVPMEADELDTAELLLALQALLDAPKPVAVHCWHGSDRTGAVVAAWRVALEGWTPAEAHDEMTAGGFGHHERYENLRALVLGLDRAQLRAELGLAPAP